MSFIYVPFSYLMKFCLLISGNYYILALFFFALIIQVILLPLSIKQQKSQISTARVKPKELAIREKYKGRTDKATQQKMNLEIQDMYRANGVNQLAGCLPLLIQLPIILILFAIVREPINYSSNISNFDIGKNASAIVRFYEDEKEAIIKDGLSAEEYNKLISEIEGIQINLNAKNVDSAKSELTGNKIYTRPETDAASAYCDMTVTKFIIDGRADVEKLIADGRLPAAFITKYEALDLERYASELPKFTTFGLNIVNEPDFGENLWLMLVPLLVFLSSFFSGKLTRKFSAQANATGPDGKPVGGGLFMEVGMPLISAIFAYSMPAAIGIYWIWRTGIGAVQTVVISKVMPIPAVTEEQLAEARKELKGSVKPKKKKVVTIEVDEDDDSYEDIRVKRNVSAGAVRKPRKIEMLTADDDTPEEQDSIEAPADNDEKQGDGKELPH